MNIRQFVLPMGFIVFSAGIAFAQPSFHSYTGDDSDGEVGPITTRWVGSQAVCDAPYTNRTVGLYFRFISTCQFPNNSGLSLRVYWDPLIGYTIFGEGRAVNLLTNWTQHIYYARSRCDVGSGNVADVIIDEDDDFGCYQ
jgi:hypothetical protein